MKTIKVARKEEDRETYRYFIIGPRCTAAYFRMALQHVFGTVATAGCVVTVIDQAGKKVRLEGVSDGDTYFVLFEGDGGSFEEEAIESEVIDSQLQDSNRLKVVLPDAYLTLKIEEMRRQTVAVLTQLTFRMDYSRNQMRKVALGMKETLGMASAEFLTYASEVNAQTYRKSLITPRLSEALEEANSLLSSLRSLHSQPRPALPKPRACPEKLPAMAISKKLLEETGVSKEELKRFLRFTSRATSEVQSEVTSHVTTPKAGTELDRSRTSHDAKSVSGSDTSMNRERKLLTRLRDKAKASETVLQNSISAVLYDNSVVSRVQLIVSSGELKLSGLGRGTKSMRFPLGEMESVKRSDEYDRALVVRFQDGRELKIGFMDESAFHSWIGAFEDQLALIRGSLVSPRKVKDALS